MITDKKTIEMLTSAGWYAGRSVDITECKRELEAHGLELFPAAEQFLKEFSGVTLSWHYQIDIGVEFPEIVDRTYVIEFHWMDFEHAPVEDIEFCKLQVGDDLCFVGDRTSDIEMFAICRDGRFIGLNDGELCLYGDTYVEGLMNIVHDNRPTKWYGERGRENEMDS